MRRLLGRRLLGTAVLLLALAGCGSDDGTGSTADGSASGPGATPTGDASTVTLVSATSGGGGLPEERVTFLASDGALASYVQQFSDGFATTLTRAAQQIDVGAGQVLVAQLVMVGCDKPAGADVSVGEDGVAIEVTPVPTPHRECLAPVTTVGLAVVPVSLEGGGR